MVCFVGLCGAGMAPLAIYLSERGMGVYGWDDFPDLAIKDLLISKKVLFLPEKKLPDGCDAVIISSAIHPDVDEICRAASDLGIPILKRGEYLARITEDRKLVAIVGSHGKTSVCANIAELVIKNDVHADYVVGGFFKKDKYPPAQYFPDSKWVIAEVDESDCTMEFFSPQMTVALNYDDDHIANYHGSDGLKSAFQRFFSRTKEKIFLTKEDKIFPNLLSDAKANVEFLGNLSEKNFVLRNQEIAKRVFCDIFGSNLTFDINFDGVKRRDDLLCKTDNITFMHDYAHHPTEVNGLLRYVRSKYPNHLITAVFQPHRVSRTQQYYKEFAQILQSFDSIILLDIYRAFEERSSKVSSNLIFDRISNSNKLLVEDINQLKSTLWGYCQNLDPEREHLVLFICAGDLVKYAKDFANDWSIDVIKRELVDVEYSENVSLRDKTTFGCDSVARLMVYPKDIDQLQSVVFACRKYNKDYFVLGNGSNVVFPDGIFEDVVIKLEGAFWQQTKLESAGILRVYSGTKLPNLSRCAKELGFNCCSFLSCVPGTVGGAVRMNAGAHGCTISEIVDAVTILDDKGEIIKLESDECGFKYRGSSVVGVVLYADIKLKNIDFLSEQDFAETRSDTQPAGRTFGSIFKNPPDEYAGRLIDAAGLKGTKRGDAVISDKHANFMLNLGHATAKDVEALVDYVRYTVFKKFSIFLENEFLLLRK